jgi:hypothetical protein
MSCCSDAGSVTGPTNKAFGSLGLTIPPSLVRADEIIH